MSRPVRCRKIGQIPQFTVFEPVGILGRDLEEVTLTLDEFEAIRLADLQGLYQEDAAKQMNVSRQTFGNILVSAHQKIADCLIHGKSLTIDGGNIEMKEQRFQCVSCHHAWSESPENGRLSACPTCQSEQIYRMQTEFDIENSQQTGCRHRRRCCANNKRIPVYENGYTDGK